MRDAMTADDHESAGIYVGTRNGAVWASADSGDSWQPDRRPTCPT